MNLLKYLCALTAFGLGLPGVAANSEFTIDEWLRSVREQYPVFQALASEKAAATLRQEEGDLRELAPFFIAEGRLVDDRKPQLIPAFSGDRTRNDAYTFALSKKFSTGTTANMNYSQQNTELFGTSFGDVGNWSGSLGVGLSQALWQNAFGQGTRLRQSREEATTKAVRISREIEARQILIRAEQAYWQWLRAANERSIRHQEISSAKRLVSWARERVSKQLSDPSDLLQAEALLTSTELQVIGNDDEYAAALRQLDQFVPGSSGRLADRLKPPLVQARTAAASPFSGNKIRLDVVALEAQSKVSSFAAEEVVESLKPDLSLFASYSTNSLEPSFSKSFSSTLSTARPTAAIGLKFSVNLDQSGKNAVRSAYSLDAEGLAVRAKNLRRESEISWSELARRYGELLRRIDVAKQLVSVQETKLSRERSLLQLGRSSTFQVITFEREATASRLALLQLLVEQKNIEAQGGLFVEESKVEEL